MDANTTKTIKINHKTNVDGWTKEKVQRYVCSNDRALERAVLFVQSMQTRDEQLERVTKYWNARGWTMTDAKRGGRWAKYISMGYGLREWEKATVRRVMKKYWRQLLSEIATKKGYTVVK